MRKVAFENGQFFIDAEPLNVNPPIQYTANGATIGKKLFLMLIGVNNLGIALLIFFSVCSRKIDFHHA